MQSRVFPILCHSTSCSSLCLFKRCSFFSDDDVSGINMMDRWRVVSWIFLVVVSPSRSVPRISRKLIRTNERRNWISRRKLMERSVDHLYGFHRISSEKYRREGFPSLWGIYRFPSALPRGQLRQPGYPNRRPMGFHASLLAWLTPKYTHVGSV